MEELTESMSDMHIEQSKKSKRCILGGNTIVHINRTYQIIKELGKGTFANIYEAINVHDNKLYALKIFKYGSDYYRYYENEVYIHIKAGLNTIYTDWGESQDIGPNNHLSLMRDTFIYLQIEDGTPRAYPCIVFDKYGDNLADVIDHLEAGLTLPTVKRIAREILTGFADFHEKGVAHADIKPDNILMRKTIEDTLSNDDISVLVADFGSSSFCTDLRFRTLGARNYISPELIVKSEYDTATDIWSFACMIYELITGKYLFDVYDSFNTSNFTMNDERAIEGADDVDSTTDMSDGSTSSKSNSSDDSIDDEYEDNFKHLLLIEQLVGKPPRSFTDENRSYYNSKGNLKNNPTAVERESISSILTSKHDFAIGDAKQTEDFILNCLHFNRHERPSAHQLLKHPWLQ